MRPACDRRTPLPLIVLSVCAFIGGTAGWWLAARGRTLEGMSILIPAVAGSAGIGVIWAAVEWIPAVASLDAWIERWSRTHARGGTDAVLERATDLGSSPVALAVCGAVAVAALLRRRRLVAAYLVVTPLGSLVSYTAVKYLTNRARPTLNPDAGALNPAFPSGHAALAAAAYTGAAFALTALAPEAAPWPRRFLGATAVAIAVAVGATRVLLGLHWFSDVIAGLMLGWSWWAVATVVLVERRRPGPPA